MVIASGKVKGSSGKDSKVVLISPVAILTTGVRGETPFGSGSRSQHKAL